MPLNLTPEDQAEYDRQCRENNAVKDEATRQGNAALAKKMRQANTALYSQYLLKQIPEPVQPLTLWERESRMTLVERIERIEQHLKLGYFAED